MAKKKNPPSGKLEKLEVDPSAKVGGESLPAFKADRLSVSSRGKIGDPRPSETLRAFVEESGLTDYKIAKISGVDKSQIMRWRKRERTLSLPAFDRLCTALGLRLVRHTRKRFR